MKTKDQSSKNTGDPVKTRDQSSKNTGDSTNVSTGQQSTGSSPISPGTIVVDPEELPRHPGRKAARPSTQIAEELDQVP